MAVTSLGVGRNGRHYYNSMLASAAMKVIEIIEQL